MPSKSRSQQHLMAAAEHGATFPLAQKIRASMTHQQMHDFASGSMAGKPAHVKPPSYAERVRSTANPVRVNPPRTGLSRGNHPVRNLGRFAHPKRG